MSEERCCACDARTGRAGRDEDSHYTENGDGPYCDECWTLLPEAPDA